RTSNPRPANRSRTYCTSIAGNRNLPVRPPTMTNRVCRDLLPAALGLLGVCLFEGVDHVGRDPAAVGEFETVRFRPFPDRLGLLLTAGVGRTRRGRGRRGTPLDPTSHPACGVHVVGEAVTQPARVLLPQVDLVTHTVKGEAHGGNVFAGDTVQVVDEL